MIERESEQLRDLALDERNTKVAIGAGSRTIKPEDTERLEMAKRLPGEMKAVLLEEWRRSPWLTELLKVIDGAREATKQTEKAARSLVHTVKKAGSIVAIASAVIPLVILCIAYWNLSDLREQWGRLEQINTELEASIKIGTQAEKALAEEVTRQKSEIQKLSTTAETLRDETGGFDVVDNNDGTWEVIFPAHAQFTRQPLRNIAGRFVVSYSVSGK